jgi:hypothetical protein
MRILIMSKLLLRYLYTLLNTHACQAYWQDYTPWFIALGVLFYVYGRKHEPLELYIFALYSS